MGTDEWPPQVRRWGESVPDEPEKSVDFFSTWPNTRLPQESGGFNSGSGSRSGGRDEATGQPGSVGSALGLVSWPQLEVAGTCPGVKLGCHLLVVCLDNDGVSYRLGITVVHDGGPGEHHGCQCQILQPDTRSFPQTCPLLLGKRCTRYRTQYQLQSGHRHISRQSI